MKKVAIVQVTWEIDAQQHNEILFSASALSAFFLLFWRKFEFCSTIEIMQDHLWNSIKKLMLTTDELFEVPKCFVNA